MESGITDHEPFPRITLHPGYLQRHEKTDVHNMRQSDAFYRVTLESIRA
jgi:hypothetical protein